MTLLTLFLAILLGLALLTWGADRFVDGAVAYARNHNISPLIIGLTIIAFGTSAPEILVSATASLSGEPDMAIGNALGSNIANIGLVLGVTALVAPLPLKRIVLLRELPILLASTVLAYPLFTDGSLGRLDGIILLAMMAVALWLLSRKAGGAPPELTEEVNEAPIYSSARAMTWTLIGLTILIAGSRLLVWGAVGLANYLHVDPLIIGLSVVAVGTSLPEMAASLASAIKGHHDVALGNIIGSNLFNLLVVAAMPALIAPTPISESVRLRDYGTMALLTFLLAGFAYLMPKKGKLARLEGGILLAVYLGYSLLLYQAARASG
ncbi:calcium/sodium antiporter [Mangrovitalea sediminis]|uniref:calcium/sodium antiporter n=1 Tax=Mangrovitalea sediminis TaxID=1982043 RepID=UPI000BE53951|nr:calcium/sodium antiporter [Mangrovitalea sediminis]